MARAVWWVRLDSTRNQLANSVRFPEVRAVAVGFAPPRADPVAKRTKAVESVAQSLAFRGDGFRESLLNPVKNRSMGVGNKGREFSRIGFEHGKFVEFFPTPRAGRPVRGQDKSFGWQQWFAHLGRAVCRVGEKKYYRRIHACRYDRQHFDVRFRTEINSLLFPRPLAVVARFHSNHRLRLRVFSGSIF